MASSADSIGLIAGEGEFPRLVIRGAKAAGCRVVVVGLRGSVDVGLRAEADAFFLAGVARLGRWIRLFRRENCSRAIMAGRVRKSQMLELPKWRQYLAYLPDWTSIKVWYFSAADRRNDTLLRAVADEMRRKGVELVDSTMYCREAMAGEGLIAGPQPSASVSADADLGWRIAKEMGRLDVGQSVAVKDKDVIAVEAIEGTDAMIERAASLCKSGGWVLVKVAKPDQDKRFDVPTIGPQTIRSLASARAAAVVIESGSTLILERDATVEVAARQGISIIGRANKTQTGD